MKKKKKKEHQNNFLLNVCVIVVVIDSLTLEQLKDFPSGAQSNFS